MPVDREQQFAELLAGKVPVGFSRLDHEFQGEVSAGIVTFMQIGQKRWLRFFFDYGVFFWREVQSPDPSRVEEGHTYRLVALPEAVGLIGRKIREARFHGSNGDPNRSVLIDFEGGPSLRLVSSGDDSVLVYQ